MATGEITVAEMLKQADYKTAVFGKWHLGDSYPSRPMDQGFDESLIHLAGGMGQVGDFTTWFKGDRSYFDPVLWNNGKQEAYQGYCSDIFTSKAIEFIDLNRDRPFFCYLSFNAPHTPLQVPEKYYDMYKNVDPSDGFRGDSEPFHQMDEKDKEAARKVYAMVTNIDDNIGKLIQKLEELNIKENTVVMFMTDNGPQQVRYNAGMRGRKTMVYRGGVRVPFYLAYPGKFKGNQDIDVSTAHLDIMPTLAEICGVPLPKDRRIDGKSLVPLIKGEQVDWQERSLFFNWTRKHPEKYFGMALQKGSHKLVAHNDYNAPIDDFELFDIGRDPYEQKNIVSSHPALAESLKSEMDTWYNELIRSENLINPPRIILGSEYENPVVLNRNDAGGERGIWDQEEIYGKWRVSINKGIYNIKIKFIRPIKPGGRMLLETGQVINQLKIDGEVTDIIEMNNVSLPDMDCDLVPGYMVEGKTIFPFWLEAEKINK
jgi:arylsulfatase